MSYSPAPLALDGSKPAPWNVDAGFVAPEYQGMWRDLALLVPYWEHNGASVRDYASGLTGTFRNGNDWSIARNGPAHDMRWSVSDDTDVVFANSPIWDKAGTEITVVVLGIPRYGGDPAGADNRGLAGTSDSNSDGWRFFASQSGEVLRWRIPERTSLDIDDTNAWQEFSTVLWAGRADADGMYLDAFDLTVNTHRAVSNTTGGAWSATGDQLSIGKAFSTSSNANFDGQLLLFGLWHRRLSDKELRLLADDPFGLIRPNWDSVTTAAFDPANLQATVDGDEVTLTWDASF